MDEIKQASQEVARHLEGPYPFHLSQVSCSKLMAFPKTLYLVIEALDESAQHRWRVAVEVRYTCLVGLRRSLASLHNQTRMAEMKNSVMVAGVNMAPFKKPGANDPYTVMGADAVRGALKDAGLDYTDVQQAYVSYVFGDSTSGQRVLYEVGMTGLPIVNVNNNCSSGSTALFLARQAVESGAMECALALGFEEMQPGAIQMMWNDRPGTFDHFKVALQNMGYTYSDGFAAPCMFGAAGMEYLNPTSSIGDFLFA